MDYLGEISVEELQDVLDIVEENKPTQSPKPTMSST